MPLPPILFEDEVLIAFDKPSGLLIAPDRRDKSRESLMGLVQARLGPDVANVHRIDAEASGLVLCAKTKPALDFLSGQFQAKAVEKLHLAFVVGLPSFAKASEGAPSVDEFTVDLVMKEDEGAPGRMCVVKKHGQASETAFRVLEKYPRPAGRAAFAYLECRPVTGRMHQIRLHLAVSGTPALNDPLYGDETRLMLSDLKRGYKGRIDERPLIERLALHAGGLTLTHPLTREKMTLTAPLPKDFEVALKYLRKFGPGTARR